MLHKHERIRFLGRKLFPLNQDLRLLQPLAFLSLTVIFVNLPRVITFLHRWESFGNHEVDYS